MPTGPAIDDNSLVTSFNQSKNAAELHVLRLGAGRPVIMLHGWGQSGQSLRPMADLLSRFYQVHLVDLPGFGKSPLPSTDWTTSQYADRILQYIVENALRDTVVVGHSFGGRIAVQLFARQHDQLSALVLIGAHGLRNTDFKRTVRANTLKSAAKILKFIDRVAGTSIFRSWFVPLYASTDYKNAGRLTNILVKAVNEDLSSQAATITQQTLLLWGELDQETPPVLGRRYQQLIRHSHLIVMPNKAHTPFQNGGEHLCTRYIIDFLISQGRV